MLRFARRVCCWPIISERWLFFWCSSLDYSFNIFFRKGKISLVPYYYYHLKIQSFLVCCWNLNGILSLFISLDTWDIWAHLFIIFIFYFLKGNITFRWYNLKRLMFKIQGNKILKKAYIITLGPILITKIRYKNKRSHFRKDILDREIHKKLRKRTPRWSIDPFNFKMIYQLKRFTWKIP